MVWISMSHFLGRGSRRLYAKCAIAPPDAFARDVHTFSIFCAIINSGSNAGLTHGRILAFYTGFERDLQTID